MTDDGKLIELFFERSGQAVSLLDEKYGAVCRRTARNILSSVQDAEECVSDAYLAVWNNIPPERPDPLIAYLLKIVRNISLKKHRANTALKRGSGYDAALDELSECLPSPESADNVLDALTLAAGDGLGELAKLFGISRHAASARLYRTREKLRILLKKEGEEI